MDKVYSFVADRTGERLDKYVIEQHLEFSRSFVQKLIADGYITVNDRVIRAGRKLRIDDKVKIVIPSFGKNSLMPEDMKLSILYENEDLLVVDKPAGVIVHPAPGHPNHTLINAVLSHFPNLVNVNDSFRPGVVHRLDKDTSGLILIAKNAPAQANLSEQFKSHSVEKAYLVLVKGHLTPVKGIIEADIGRDPGNRKRMAVVSKGRQACTEYQVLEYKSKSTLLEVKPKTGRTHQIRVHLAAVGFPVMGDSIYGIRSVHLSRQFLHASQLRFRLPSNGEFIEFTSPLPLDLEHALELLR